jgi:hypothetical protein
MRTVAELVDRREPGLALVREWLRAASNPVELLPCEAAAGERSLLALQVTTRSPLGALAYETAGLLVDRGWLRLLGAGGPRLPRGLAEWNRLGKPEPRMPGALLIGDDAVGGFFALNGGGLPGTTGHVFYLAPDTLDWEDLAVGYSEWVRWACAGDLEKFYAKTRWPEWAADAAALPGDRAFSIFPFLWLQGPPIAERSRRPIPVAELWQLHAVELPGQLTREKTP